MPLMDGSRLSFRQRTRLIVGLDYGTTYSGISFALSDATDFRDITPWTNFPGASSHNSRHCEKAPSRVAYASENPELDNDVWGYQLEPGMTAYSWTKLLLDDSALTSDYDDPNLRRSIGNNLMRLPPGKTAKDVVTDYFRGMYAMFKTAIDDRLGSDRLRDLPIDVWLTVPATWSEKAKLFTQAAAKDAGFASRAIDRIMLIPEPEAAAHMALKSSMRRVDDLVEEGSCVMICDLGGGTVDITSYQVHRTSPTLKLKELCVGNGGKCGGTFVDRNLYALLSKRFGKAFTSLPYEMTGPGSDFADDFEEKKKDFSLDHPSRRPTKLNLVMRDLGGIKDVEKYYDQTRSQVLLSLDDMRSLFDPVVEMIFQLVEDQETRSKKEAGKGIDTMVLVGGFGSSPYVKERLKTWCEARDIRLTTPWSGAWSAIVCGAVLRGVEGSITTQKKCRRHYGHAWSLRYEPGTHKEWDSSKRHKWYNRFDKETMLSGFMEWKIAKNDVLDENTEIDSLIWKTYQYPFKDKYFETLYACSLDEAPVTLDNERVERIGEVEYTIDKLDIRNNDQVEHIVDEEGVHHYRVNHTLNIRMSDETGLLVFRIMSGGKEIGTAKLGFSYI